MAKTLDGKKLNSSRISDYYSDDSESELKSGLCSDTGGLYALLIKKLTEHEETKKAKEGFGEKRKEKDKTGEV